MNGPPPPTNIEMRAIVLDAIEERDGKRPTRVGARGAQTYRTRGGSMFHLRTRFRDPQASGKYRYWFGIRDECWVEGQSFALVCDRDFVLVVPVEDWLPYLDHFSISQPGTPQQSRQPHILWHPGTDSLELVEGDLRLDVSQWKDRLDLLA